MNWVLKHFLAYLFQNNAEALLTLVKHFVRWFFITNLYLNPKRILYVCYKKRIHTSFYASDTNKHCQQECRLQCVIALTHRKSLEYCKLSQSLSYCVGGYFPHLNLGDKCTRDLKCSTNKNPVNLSHGGMEAMQLVHLHIQWAGRVWFRNKQAARPNRGELHHA